MRRHALSLLTAVLAACGSPARSVPDAKLPDPPVDGGSPDVVQPDAALPDGAVSDAAVPDAVLPDAALSDAAVPDAAVPDAATSDAALPDAAPVVVHVTDLDPQIGPAAGGDAVTVYGDGFVDGATAASLGGAPLGGITVASPTQLTGTTPAGTGFADATVTIGATTATLPRAYFFGAWVPVGPSGGQVRDLVTVGATDVFAATAAGVYRSTDRGVSWAPASTGLGSLDVRGLAVDPGQPAHMFAATTAGVYATTTAGASWARVGNSPPSATRIAIAPGRTDLLLALEPPRLHRSADGGATWTQVITGGVGGGAAIAFAPGDPSLVLLAVNDGNGPGILKSTDGGMAWNPAAAGIDNTFATSVAFDPANAAIVYAVAMSRVYKSVNGAATWSRLTGYNLPFVPPARIVVDPAGKLYAGSSDAKVARSTDGGATWADISTGIAAVLTSDVNCLAVRASAPAELHIGVGGEGIFRSLDAGASWARSDAGVDATAFSSIAASPVTAGRALAVGGGGVVWRTLDHGATWLRSITGLPLLAPPRVVAFDPSGVAFVGTSGEGAYRSTDGGATWTASNQGLRGVQINAFLFDPDLPSRVYAVADQGVHRSLDGGSTWARVFSGGFTSITTSVIKRGSAVLVANQLLFRSADDGATWRQFGTGLPSIGLTALYADPADPAVAYAIAQERVYRSADGGATWTAVTPEGMRITALAIDPNRAATVYLGTADGPAVLRSLTGLATLRRFDTGLPAGVSEIAVDRSGGTVYLATATAGLRRAGR